jgi:hypothetical protein
LVQTDLEMDAVHPHIHVVGISEGVLLNAVALSCHPVVARVIVAADKPAAIPRVDQRARMRVFVMSSRCRGPRARCWEYRE